MKIKNPNGGKFVLKLRCRWYELFDERVGLNATVQFAMSQNVEPGADVVEIRGIHILQRLHSASVGSIRLKSGGNKFGVKMLALLALLCTGAAVTRAQGTDDQIGTQRMAKGADPDWEVVTIRAADPNGQNSGFHVQGRDVYIERKPVETMLLFGYDLHKRQILNAPDWVRQELWDVKGYANVPGEPDKEQFRSMIRKLLAQRFGLVFHTEQQEAPAYALVPAKGCPKLTPSKGDPDAQQDGNDGENGGVVTMQMTNTQMKGLAGELTYFLDRPVLDQTGLTIKYDFILRWTSDETKVPTDGSAPPSVFTALQEQLGLKLEPVKTQVKVMVVDKVERPGAN